MEGERQQEQSREIREMLEQARKPIPELERLRGWVGRWTAQERYERNEFTPQGGTANGTAEVHLGPAGILVERYHSEGGPMGTFDGHLMITFDRQKNEYLLYWFDSIDPRGMPSRGRWEGEQLVFTGEGTTLDGKPHSWRMTYKDIRESSRTMESAMSFEGGPMKVAFSVVYARAPELH